MKSSTASRKCLLALLGLTLSSVGCWVETAPPPRVVHVEHAHEHHAPAEDNDDHHEHEHGEHEHGEHEHGEHEHGEHEHHD